MICGPEIMMRYTAEALLARGVPASRVYVSMERNMTCGLGYCGHCQLGPTLICRDGPVYRWDVIEPLMAVREL
jgi:NAD(P)H-flavin reductase